jgi:hypothetical protein
MAAITATSISVIVLPTTAPGSQAMISNKTRMQRCRIEISATQALTYPSSGGIPLPTYNATAKPAGGDNSYGMTRGMDYLVFYDYGPQVSANGVMWTYTSSDHTLRGYLNNPTGFTGVTIGFAELPTTYQPSGALGSNVFHVQAWGW